MGRAARPLRGIGRPPLGPAAIIAVVVALAAVSLVASYAAALGVRGLVHRARTRISRSELEELRSSPQRRDARMLRAVDDDDTASIRALVEIGAPTTVAGAPAMESPLHRAAFWGPRTVRALTCLAECSPDVDTPDRQGETPLTTAVLRESDGGVRVLLSHHADPNHVDQTGKAPLHHAAALGRTEIVRALLAAGARVDEPARKYAATPLCIAAGAGEDEVVRALLRAGASPSGLPDGRPLVDAAAHGHDEVVLTLVAAGADPNVRRGLSGTTPLHAAAQRGHVQTVQALLNAGADPQARDARGRTPGDLARQAGMAAVVAALDRAGR